MVEPKPAKGGDGMRTDMGVLEELAAGIARFEKQRDMARAEVERAVKMLEELNARRTTLAPGPLFSGERETAEKLEALVAALDQESAALSRTKILAEDAAQELDRLVLEAEVRHHEEEKRLARGRYEALCEERYSLDGEAEEVITRLVQILDRLEGLYAEQVRAATDAEDPSPVHQEPRGTTEQWLARRLRRWLSLGSLEKYDAPLSDLDPLAMEPKRDEKV
jgi:hypothetical protein